MEQPSQQSNNAHASVGQNPIQADFWNNIEELYPQQPQPTQHQHQQHPQQQQTPQGITWDHPIFAQRGQQHQQQQPQVPQSQEHVRDLYSGTPQTWAQNPSPAPQSTNISQPQAYGLSHQHPYQLQQYPQDQQLGYEPQNLASGELSYASSYSIPGQYYQPAGLQPSDAYPQTQHRSIAPRPAAQQPQLNAASQQTTQPHHQYILPAANYGENGQGNSHFNQFAETAPAINYQNTIDPRFLSGQPADQAPSGQSSFLFYNPTASSYERPNDPKAYQMYPDNLAALNAEQLNARHHIHPQFAQYPELAPYPMSTGVLVPPGHNAALAKKTSTAKSKTQKASARGAKKADGRSVSESETDTSDSELEVEEPEEPSPLPPVRPTDADGAAQYDSIKAVWSPRNRRPKAEKIKASLVAFKDVVKAVRDEWKTLSQAMKDAENQNANEKAAELRSKVVQQRQIMNVVVSTTLDKGHPIIIEKLGEHPMAVAALYSFLLDRHQASDYEGVLLVNILKLLARFTTMDEDTLTKTNISKLLPRIIKKGIQPGKDLAQKIVDNAAASTKRKKESAAVHSTSKDNTPDRGSESSRSESVVGSKRPHDGESNSLPATKKAVASSAAKGSVAAKTAGAPVKPADGKPTAPAVRPKANIAPPKPTSLFGSLASASKKPGTSNAARAAAAAAAAKEKANAPPEKEAPAPAPVKPAFSFGDILADLNKKEDTKAPKASETRPPETEEEREKRLRKEARRKLRVSWKPESSLVEVRFFTHDPDEEIGADDDRKRDVADIKGEGRMLKLHKDLDEDEEEESGPQEEEFSPWTSLIAIEMENLSSEEQENNFIKRGGTKEPDSPEKLAQETREANTLMVFYTSPADVPPTPKEPPEPSEEEEPTTEQSFGEPDDSVKGRSDRYFSMLKPPPKPAAPPVPVAAAAPANGPLDITNLLKVIQSGPQQAQSTPPPQPIPSQPAPLAELERTINIFRQHQGQPPQSMPQIPQMPQAAAQPIDFQKILAVLNAQKQVGAPQPQLPIQLPPSQPSIAPNLAALVSQLGGNAAAQPVSQPPSQYSSGLYEDPERKRMRDTGRSYENGFGQSNAKRPRMYVDPEAKKHPRAGSVPCRFWRENKCLKGDDCTFRHDPADLE